MSLFLPASRSPIPTSPQESHSPLSSPLHELVSDEQRHAPIENLTTGAAEGVKDGGVQGAGKRVLAVLCDTVVNDTLLRERAESAPGAEVAVVLCQYSSLAHIEAGHWAAMGCVGCGQGRVATYVPGFLSPPLALRICEGRIVTVVCGSRDQRGDVWTYERCNGVV